MNFKKIKGTKPYPHDKGGVTGMNYTHPTFGGRPSPTAPHGPQKKRAGTSPGGTAPKPESLQGHISYGRGFLKAARGNSPKGDK